MAKNGNNATVASQLSKHNIWMDSIVMVFCCFMVAVTYYTFITPNNFAPGGIYGLGSMIQNKTHGVFGLENGIPWAIPVFLFSVPLIIGSAIILDKRSAIVVTVTVLLTNAIDILLEVLHFPQFIGVTEVQKCFSAAIGGMISGTMFAVSVKYFGTADGTIALSALIKAKKPEANIAWLNFMLDVVVVVASLFVYWKENTVGISGFNMKLVYASQPIMYALITMFFVSKCCDLILKGWNQAYKFEIVTEEPEELSKILLEKLSRGVTAIPAKGMYSGVEKSIIVCIVPKNQIGDFKRILTKYPNTFTYISSTNEIIGDYKRKTIFGSR